MECQRIKNMIQLYPSTNDNKQNYIIITQDTIQCSANVLLWEKELSSYLVLFSGTDTVYLKTPEMFHNLQDNCTMNEKWQTNYSFPFWRMYSIV